VLNGGADVRSDPVAVPIPSYFFGAAGSGIGRYRDERPPEPEKLIVLLLHGWAGTAELNWSHVYGVRHTYSSGRRYHASPAIGEDDPGHAAAVTWARR